jgi:hypothetical protein
VLVTGDEVRGLRDRGSLICPALAGPDRRRQAHDGRVGLSDDAVPVMHDQRISVSPSNVWDSQSPWPIHTHPGVEVSRPLTRRAASSIHSGPVTMLRSCPCSSRSGHSPSPGWSHPVHGGEGVTRGTLAGVGADLMRRARSAANGAAPSSGGKGRPPGIAASAVIVRSRTRVAPVSGCGHGKPARASSTCTRRQPAIRGWKGRALTTTCRPLDN